MTELKKCKRCGSYPVLWTTRGDIHSTFYVCPKALNRQCMSSEIEEREKRPENGTKLSRIKDETNAV